MNGPPAVCRTIRVYGLRRAAESDDRFVAEISFPSSVGRAMIEHGDSVGWSEAVQRDLCKAMSLCKVGRTRGGWSLDECAVRVCVTVTL